MASVARLSLDVLHRAGGPGPLLTLAVHRLALASFGRLPLGTRIDLAYPVVVRRASAA